MPRGIRPVSVAMSAAYALGPRYAGGAIATRCGASSERPPPAWTTPRRGPRRAASRPLLPRRPAREGGGDLACVAGDLRQPRPGRTRGDHAGRRWGTWSPSSSQAGAGGPGAGAGAGASWCGPCSPG
jgi:hypothetical protein